MDKSRMIHKRDEITRRFYQVDKLLLENPRYKDLSDGAILTWSILRDRMELSKQNADVFSDEEGYLFLIYTDAELAEILHRNRKTANARKKELEKFGLLYNVRMGNQEANRLYLLEPEKCDPEEYISNQFRKKKKAEIIEKQIEKAKAQKKKYVMIEITEDEEINSTNDETLVGVMKGKKRTSLMGKKRTSRRVKNGHPDVPNLGCNDTKVLDTDSTDTDNLSIVESEISSIDLPESIKQQLSLHIDRLMDDNINIQDVQLIFKTFEDRFNEFSFATKLADVLQHTKKEITNIRALLTKSINKELNDPIGKFVVGNHEQKAAPTKKKELTEEEIISSMQKMFDELNN